MITTNRTRGKAFRLVGMILGIVSLSIAITSLVFSAVGMHQARLCKNCRKGVDFQ